MEMWRCFLLLFPIAFTYAVTLVCADQDGFISIDCGIPEGSDYTDATTGIHYISDASFVDSGESQHIQAVNNTNSLERQFVNLRSFPKGTRNCYTLSPSSGNGSTYLIRASFLYGNYDNKSQLPKFDLQLGVDTWGTIRFANPSYLVRMEIIHNLTSNYVQVCLINTGNGIPFISALELRLLPSSMYTTESGSLQFGSRVGFGLAGTKSIRYKDDVYDRIWNPDHIYDTTTLSAPLNSTFLYNDFQVPSIVISTAITPQDASDNLDLYWTPINTSEQYYVYMHFGEVEKLQANQSRKFDIYINEVLWNRYGPLDADYLGITTQYSTRPLLTSPRYNVSIRRATDSTLPPIINAFESYTVKLMLNLQTEDSDVAAMHSIKKTYGVQRNWQGDPCAPAAFVWEGLTCSSDVGNPRVVSLNLADSGLTGEIASGISNLTMIKTLDLSNNNLTGKLPDFLAEMSSLHTLYLKGNNFTGPIPEKLIQKRDEGSLALSIDDSTVVLPHKNGGKKNVVIPVVASVISVSIVLFAVLALLWMRRRNKKQPSGGESPLLDPKKQQFTISEVEKITNNFQRVIGQGGFGVVYHGCIDKTQVAVKMLSPTSAQGYKEFQAEAKILMNVNHRSLTHLVGYCHEGTNMGIIYEFMVNGNLRQNLSEETSKVLGWRERLQIAIDAAQGLEYLHHGCKPSIIHRDVKSTNILLNEKFEAKLADFGLSRAFPIEGGTHVSTIAAGTPGYMDPECFAFNRLTEKSDVYSFGVVLMEVITGQAPLITNGQESSHISQWLSSMVETGDVKNIADPRLRGDFNISSVWRAVELATACVDRTPARRPTMTYVVAELKACLAAEIAHLETGSNDSIGMSSTGIESAFHPRAR